MITDRPLWSQSSTPNESLVAPGASVPSWSCDHLLPQCTCGTEFISDFAVRPSDLPSVSVPGQPRDHLRLRHYCRPAPISAFERSHFVFRTWFSRFCSRTFANIRGNSRYFLPPPPGASVRRSAFALNSFRDSERQDSAKLHRVGPGKSTVPDANSCPFVVHRSCWPTRNNHQIITNSHTK